MATLIEIPTLRTGRLTLRAYRAGDLDALAALNADPRFRAHLGGNLLTREQSWGQMEAALGQWALRGYGLFAVESDRRMIGRIGVLHPADWPEPELAWGVSPDAWGFGLATEAARAVRDWAFDRFAFPRLVSFIMPENARSRRVAEKLGAYQDGQVEIRGLRPDLWVHPRPGAVAQV
jgi:RimJ/RimL family protein N-acetyltransferase